MASSGLLCRVALVKSDVSEEFIDSIIRVTIIGELGMLAITSNRCTLRRNTTHLVFLRSVRRLLVTASVVPSSPILVTLIMEALSSSETSLLTRAARRNIPENAILQPSLSSICVRSSKTKTVGEHLAPFQVKPNLNISEHPVGLLGRSIWP
jgi:hypothetical protein